MSLFYPKHLSISPCWPSHIQLDSSILWAKTLSCDSDAVMLYNSSHSSCAGYMRTNEYCSNGATVIRVPYIVFCWQQQYICSTKDYFVSLLFCCFTKFYLIVWADRVYLPPGGTEHCGSGHHHPGIPAPARAVWCASHAGHSPRIPCVSGRPATYPPRWIPHWQAAYEAWWWQRGPRGAGGACGAVPPLWGALSVAHLVASPGPAATQAGTASTGYDWWLLYSAAHCSTG